ncbi:hypothetical protein [Kordia jejudonensis]|uniref:hypothetical protein n=1 Tax=Kordia jejudonensis TaxID=1348245 RepID=UPI00062962C9|nr:hypothetical protein [Kordia jejudonensis]
MKKIIYIITLTFIFSCKIQSNIGGKVLGIYETKKKGVFGRIMINKDSSFVYQYNVGLIKTESKGNWKLENNDILILQSSAEYLTNQIQVKEYIGNSEIIIRDAENNPIQGVFVIFENDQKALETDEKGIIRINNYQNIKKFDIHYLGETYNYQILNQETNSYKVILYLSDLSKTYFNRQKFKLKNKSLVDVKGLKFIKQK